MGIQVCIFGSFVISEFATLIVPNRKGKFFDGLCRQYGPGRTIKLVCRWSIRDTNATPTLSLQVDKSGKRGPFTKFAPGQSVWCSSVVLPFSMLDLHCCRCHVSLPAQSPAPRKPDSTPPIASASASSADSFLQRPSDASSLSPSSVTRKPLPSNLLKPSPTLIFLKHRTSPDRGDA